MTRPCLRFRLAAFLVLLASPWLHAEENEWTRFRGPNGTGIVADCQVPLPWTMQNEKWRVDLPGEGHSSPVIWNDRYFIASANPETAERYLASGDLRSGKIEWSLPFAAASHPLHQMSSYASCTPCVDAERVYVAWATPESFIVKAFDHQGEEKWSRDFGGYVSQHGFGSSPILVDGLLVIANSQDAEELPPNVAPGTESIVALDVRSGELKWRTQLEPTRVCYGTLCVGRAEDGQAIIYGANTQDGFFALRAKNGELLWKRPAFGKRICSSPQIFQLANQPTPWLVATEGSGGGGNQLIAIEAKPNGKEVWRVTRGAPYVPTPIVHGNLAFLWADNGIVTCVRLPDGQVQWTHRVGGNFSSSPLILGDRLLAISQEGVVHVLASREKLEDLGRIELEQTVRATPAATKDRLLIRTTKQLFCVVK